jgi:predicted metal-dependent hydrolase
MTSESYHLQVRDLQIEVLSKDIKNLHISIMPPDGRIRVSAPLTMSEESVRLAIVSKLSRIRREQKSFAKYIRESKKEMVSGESHFVDGNRYILELVEANETPSLSIKKKKTILMKVRPNSTRDKREQIMQEWLRNRMRENLKDLIPKWEGIIGVSASHYGIKRMRTKWGSCNSEQKRIWLNLELAKKSPQCLEYVLVHEIIHILEPKHSDRFFSLLDEYMSTWRIHKETLDKPPLVHVDWDY